MAGKAHASRSGNLGNENFGVAELSDAVAISRYQLHRKVKTLMSRHADYLKRDVIQQTAFRLQAFSSTVQR